MDVHECTDARRIIKYNYRIVGAVGRMIVLGLGTASVRPVKPILVVVRRVMVVVVVVFGPVRGDGGPSGRGEERHVQGDGQSVPRIVDGRDGRHGVHGPVEAQPARVHQQSHVLRGQIEERQRPGDQAGRFGRGVVGGREHGRTAVAHQRHADEQQAGRRAGQYGQRPVRSACVLRERKKKKRKTLLTDNTTGAHFWTGHRIDR